MPSVVLTSGQAKYILPGRILLILNTKDQNGKGKGAISLKRHPYIQV